MGEVVAFKSADELADEYRSGKRRNKEAEKMRRQIELLEREELNRPEYTIGIVNDDGQLEVVQAKPIWKGVRLVQEIVCLAILLIGTFNFLEGA
jgi:hypothetical protein